MQAQFIATSSSLALAVLLAAPVERTDAADTLCTSAGLATLSADQIEQGIAGGTLGQLMTDSIGANPCAKDFAALESLLEGLIASMPKVAAQAAKAVAAHTSTLAADQPETAAALALLLGRIIGDPGVTEVAAATVAETVVELSYAVRLVKRSEATQGIASTDSQEAARALEALADNSAVRTAMQDIDQRVQDSVELADAQADLRNFATAAGPAAGGDGGATGIGAAVGDAGFAAFETAAGGGGTPTATPPAASPIF